jgi:hypothetical protein
LEAAKDAHAHFWEWERVLLQGHPSELDLSTGMGFKGRPVSIHNAWCDTACKILAARKLFEMKIEGPAGGMTSGRWKT